MTDIMKLADAYAWHSVHAAETNGESIVGARDALQSAIEALQSKLGDAIQSSAHWQHQFTELPAENERLAHANNALKLAVSGLQAKLDAMGKEEPRFWYDEDMGELYSFSDNRPVDGLTPLYAAPKALAPEKVEAAWRAGWAACRDAEYVGQEAENEAWGMSQTCANADWENAAPKALAPSREVIGRYMADKGFYLSKEALDGLMLKLEGIGGTP